MNLKLDKEEFFELMTVFIVEEAKERGKALIGEDPHTLTEYEQLLAHISKFNMKNELKMAKFRVTPEVKLARNRLIKNMEIAEHVRIMTG